MGEKHRVAGESVARGPGTGAAAGWDRSTVAAAVLSDGETDDSDRDSSAHHAGTAGATCGTREGGVDVNNSQAGLADGQGQAAYAGAADAHRAESWSATADGVWLWCRGHRA